MSQEVTTEELHIHAHHFARFGLWLGASPEEVLREALKWFEIFCYDSSVWLEDIVAYEVLRLRQSRRRLQ